MDETRRALIMYLQCKHISINMRCGGSHTHTHNFHPGEWSPSPMWNQSFPKPQNVVLVSKVNQSAISCYTRVGEALGQEGFVRQGRLRVLCLDEEQRAVPKWQYLTPWGWERVVYLCYLRVPLNPPDHIPLCPHNIFSISSPSVCLGRMIDGFQYIKSVKTSSGLLELDIKRLNIDFV